MTFKGFKSENSDEISDMISGPFPFRAGLGFHAEFIRESAFGCRETAAADSAAGLGIMLARLTDLEKLDHFLVRPGLHAGRDVFRHSLGIVNRLLCQGREFLFFRLGPGFLPRESRTDRVDFGSVMGTDYQTALFALE